MPKQPLIMLTTAMIFIALSSPPAQGACDHQPSREAMLNCVTRAYQAADHELNEAYRGVTIMLDAQQKENMVAAEKAWIAFRDAHCRFENDWYYREAHGGAVAQQECLTQLTEERTKTLWKYMNEVNE